MESKHKERDLKIPEQRQKLLMKIEEDLIADENVLAVFYGGSIGNRNTDLYSDIDLRIVVKDAVFKKYKCDKRKRAENWGRVLFFEDLSQAPFCIAHYDSFVKVDAFYYMTKDIQPSVWLQNINIVHDTTGLMREVLKQSATLSYFPNAEEIQFWRSKFFAHLHEAYRRAMRKEYYYALHCVDSLRLLIIEGWYMEMGIQPNVFGDWAKLEGERSKLKGWQLSLLNEWHCSRQPADIFKVMNAVASEFVSVHRDLCEKVGVDENPEWVKEILGMV